jgi:hypothetical protein
MPKHEDDSDIPVNLLRMDPDKYQEFFDLVGDIVHSHELTAFEKKAAVLEHMRLNNAETNFAELLEWFGGYIV